ncbi:MAG: Hsp20/alpha crystallin family protein [bacterium]|nr:Hsp20/alpha crystallin family protein [bacterium]
MSGNKEDLFDNFGVLSYEMNKFFNQMLKCKTPPRMSCRQTWCPPCDVYETLKSVIVCLEVPGIKRKDFEVAINNNILLVRGRRREARAVEKINYYQMEIHYGLFERVIPLPATIAASKIKTICANGFIEITVPKKK